MGFLFRVFVPGSVSFLWFYCHLSSWWSIVLGSQQESHSIYVVHLRFACCTERVVMRKLTLGENCEDSYVDTKIPTNEEKRMEMHDMWVNLQSEASHQTEAMRASCTKMACKPWSYRASRKIAGNKPAVMMGWYNVFSYRRTQKVYCQCCKKES